MDKNDHVLDAIDELNRINDMPEGGYFQSSKDKAYRLEAIRNIFCGLERQNQDKVLRCAMENLLNQTICVTDKMTLIEDVMA